jgi:NitT/TauT family transport system ATP-binding protein
MKARPGRVHADVPLTTSLERDAHYRTSEEYRKACETVSLSLIGAINAAGEH